MAEWPGYTDPADIRELTQTIRDAIREQMDISVPVGALTMWTKANAPAGWLVCNGSSVPVLDYPELHEVVGYTFGGSGANFALPNFTNRFPRQAAPGTTGGANSRALSAANIPAHSHTMTHGHNARGMLTDSPGNSAGTAARGTAAGGASLSTYNLINVDNYSGSTGNTGSGTSFDNQPAFLGVTFIIRAR